MRKHEHCKHQLADIDMTYLAEPERLGYEHVERRAILKNRIGALFAALVIMRVKE